MSGVPTGRSRPTSSSGRPSSSTSPRCRRTCSPRCSPVPAPPAGARTSWSRRRPAAWCARRPATSARPRKPDEVEGWRHHHDQDHDPGRAGLTRSTTSRRPGSALSGPGPSTSVPTPHRRTERHSRMSITIPAELLPADGRFGCGPSKVRPEALQALADGTAPRSWAPPTARRRSRAWSARSGRASPQLFDLPDGYEVVLGNGGTTAFWDAASDRPDPATARARHLRRVLRQVRLRGGRGAVPRRPGDRQGRTRLPGAAERAGRRRRLRLGAQRDLHRRHGAGAAAARRRRRRAGAHRRDQRRRRPARWTSTQTDVYYFAPQKSFAADGGLWIALMSADALARVAEIKASGRWIPGFLDLSIAVDNSGKDQTYNTPAVATLFLLADQIRWLLASAACRARWPAPPTPRAGSTAGPRSPRTRRRSCPTRPALPRRRHDRLRRVGGRRRAGQDAARQRRRRHRALPQARPQPAAGRHVPCRRPGRRQRADRLHRLRRRAALTRGRRPRAKAPTSRYLALRGLSRPEQAADRTGRPDSRSDPISAGGERGPGSPSGPDRGDLFAAGGEAGRLMAACDWSATPVGPVESGRPACVTPSARCSSRSSPWC